MNCLLLGSSEICQKQPLQFQCLKAEKQINQVVCTKYKGQILVTICQVCSQGFCIVLHSVAIGGFCLTDCILRCGEHIIHVCYLFIFLCAGAL